MGWVKEKGLFVLYVWDCYYYRKRKKEIWVLVLFLMLLRRVILKVVLFFLSFSFSVVLFFICGFGFGIVSCL